MNKYLVAILILFGSTPIFAQYFSGELKYTMKIIPKVDGLNIDSIRLAKLGSEFSYLITSGYYKSSYFKNDTLTYSYTYHSDSKRMFDESAGKDYITYRDSRKGNTSRIRTIVYRDSIKEVVGHPCFMVERVYENYIDKTYYAKDMKIDVESFKDHEVGDWYNQIKEVGGALSLMSVNEYTTHLEIHQVIRIDERDVKEEEFRLPKSKPVVAASTALDKMVQLKQPGEEAVSCYKSKMAQAPLTLLSQDVVCYVGFIVSESGQISHLEAYEKDEYELYKIALDIMSTCGIEFSPGQIAGKDVSSWVYFPIEFVR